LPHFYSGVYPSIFFSKSGEAAKVDNSAANTIFFIITPLVINFKTWLLNEIWPHRSMQIKPEQRLPARLRCNKVIEEFTAPANIKLNDTELNIAN